MPNLNTMHTAKATARR